MRVIRRPEVENRTGLGTSFIYAEMESGRFPQPVKIGKRAVAWLESEVDEWIRERIAARDAEARQRGHARSA